jgi:hypothetical protein
VQKDPSLVKPGGEFIRMMRWQTICFRSHDGLHVCINSRKSDDTTWTLLRMSFGYLRRATVDVLCALVVNCMRGQIQLRRRSTNAGGFTVRDSGRLIRNSHECRRELKGNTDPDADSSAKSATHRCLRG